MQQIRRQVNIIYTLAFFAGFLMTIFGGAFALGLFSNEQRAVPQGPSATVGTTIPNDDGQITELRAEQAIWTPEAEIGATAMATTSTGKPESISTPTPEPVNASAPEPADSPTPELRLPFEGTFEGTIFGDQGSQAPLTLSLIQRETAVSGTAALGEGLVFDAGGGICGGVRNISATTLDVNGNTSVSNLRHLESSSNLTIGRIRIEVEVVADLTEDDQTLTAQVALKPPFFCLQPRFPARLTRTQ